MQATRRMPLWALAIALATGKNTKLFGVLDQNENGFFTYVSQRAGKQGSHCRHERLAWVASRYGGRGLRAPAHSSRKSWERTTTELTTFILWLILKFAMCTGQEVTFEPISNVHARVDYNTLTW